MIVIADVFPRLQTVKDLVTPLFKWRSFRTSLRVNMLMGPKHMLNLHQRSFIIFFDHSEGK